LDRCVPKVAELRQRFPDKDIQVDGGIGPKTIGVCADAGWFFWLQIMECPLQKILTALFPQARMLLWQAQPYLVPRIPSK